MQAIIILQTVQCKKDYLYEVSIPEDKSHVVTSVRGITTDIRGKNH